VTRSSGVKNAGRRDARKWVGLIASLRAAGKLAGTSLLLAVAACGGSSKTRESGPKVSSQPVTRVPIEDSEPEDGVEIVHARGHMELSDVEAGIAPYTAQLTACYTKQLGKRRWIGGHVSLHWDIKADGEVTAVKLAESDLGAWPIERCLLEIARQATFAKPRGGDTDFSIPLEFSARGQISSWDEDQALTAVGDQLAELDDCADDPTKPKAKAKETAKGKAKGKANSKAKSKHNGKDKGSPKDKDEDKDKDRPRIEKPNDVTITFYVGPGGRAKSVGFSSPKTVLVDEWAECAEKAVLAWKLPDPRGQIAKLAIRYRAP
jgi:TonB family protein